MKLVDKFIVVLEKLPDETSIADDGKIIYAKPYLYVDEENMTIDGEIPKDVLKKFLEGIYNAGYDKGYAEGYDSGYDEGYDMADKEAGEYETD